jgi:hypothetical protein
MSLRIYHKATKTLQASQLQFCTIRCVHWDAAFGLGLVNLLTGQVLVAGHIDRRICLEEISRPQMNRVGLDRHDWPILRNVSNSSGFVFARFHAYLYAWVVCKPKDRPYNDILIFNVIASRDSISDAANLLS